MSVGDSTRATSSSAGSYLLCSTPRTGSTLLCELLESTTVAGRPASYFRKPDEGAFASRWGVGRSPDGALRYAEFLRAVLAAGSTDNGVFAARIMWGTLDTLVDQLESVYPDLVGRDLALLNRAFGRPRFVYLRRRDVVGQAVSWFRAEQSAVWHNMGRVKPPDRAEHLAYDFDGIHEIVQMIDEHNVAWRRWFASVGVRPFSVLYEDLDADAVGTAREILQFLELELPPGRTITGRQERMRDQLNAEWVDRYQNDVSVGRVLPGRALPKRPSTSWHRAPGL
jgi:trehalose 2-sulfotransferase